MIPTFIALAAIGLTAPSDDVNFRQIIVEVEGTLLESHWFDIEEDGKLELCLTVQNLEGARELRFYRMSSTGLNLDPFRVLPIRDDAIAFGLANLRDEPGRELFFLTKSGVWSYSLTKQGYRGNVERLIQAELIYDIPDANALPRWNYVLPGESRDTLLLPTLAGFVIFGPQQGSSTAYGALTSFEQLGRPKIQINANQGQSGSQVSIGPQGISIKGEAKHQLKAPFLSPASSTDGTFLSNQRSAAAPALLDINNDGRLDLIFRMDRELHVHLNRGGSFREKPDRTESFPAYLKEGCELSFVDLDSDGDMDLIAHNSKNSDDSSLKKETHVILVLPNDGKRLLPERPGQVLRFKANNIEVKTLDVNADGHRDLAITKMDLPSLVGALSQFELLITDLLFLGQAGPKPIARKPVLRTTRHFDADNITEVSSNRDWTHDCTGDGIADLVEQDLNGNISILPANRKKSFFGGINWSMAQAAWYRSRAASGAKSITVQDVNGDGLGDILSPGSDRLVLLLSSRSKRQ